MIALSVIAPIIAVIALGYLAVRRAVFSDDNIVTLNRFVFTLAAPALLFRNVALTVFPETLSVGLWLSYYGPLVAIMALAWFLAKGVFKARAPSEYVIIGFGGCFSNTVMLGIPIILTAFGPEAGLPLFLILAFHGLLVFTTAIISLEAATKPNLRLADLPPKIAQAMREQVVIMALAAGVVWNMTGLGLAAPVDRFLELLGAATIPVALIAVGGRLATVKIGDNLASSLYIAAFKLVLMPLVVYITAQFVFALDPLFVATLTLLAAMPTGVFASVFAAQYQTAEAEAASAIVTTTVLSAITIAVWLSFFSPLLRV